MDVDPCPSTSGDSFSNYTLLPRIEEDNILEDTNPKQKLMEILDNLEGHVENLRKDATRIEEEKDNILSTLDAVRMMPSIHELVGLDRDETHRYLDRILERCLTVDIKVHTQRDKQQEEALHHINCLIDNLVLQLQADSDTAKVRCITYMNSCSSQSHGVTDKAFETALLGCTIDDQKRVKKRLHGLLRYFKKQGYATEIE